MLRVGSRGHGLAQEAVFRETLFYGCPGVSDTGSVTPIPLARPRPTCRSTASHLARRPRCLQIRTRWTVPIRNTPIERLGSCAWGDRWQAACSWWRTRSGGQAMKRRSASSARDAQVVKKGPRTRASRQVDFSDIPEASGEQLRAMRRVGRPPLEAPRRLIAIRVDPDILDQLRKEARQRNVGYQTLIHQVLMEHVQKRVA